jgi:SNF2 family DNA or RNA helicase
MIITSPTGRIPAGPNLQGIPIRTPEVQAIREAMTDPLFDYQIKGATFLASSRRALLADEPRVGKTAAAIRACDLVNANAILWVTTGSARWDHAAAWERFSQKKRAVRVLTKGSDIPTTFGVNIVSSDLLPRLDAKLKEFWDVVVLDESHRYKSPDAKRTKVVYGPKCDGAGGIVENAEFVWCLSGTPAPNNYSELWPMLRALAPDRITGRSGKPMGYWVFTDRYCIVRNNGFGTEIIGSRNGQELKQLMKGFSLRRTLAEIAPEVPRLRVDKLRLDTADAREVMALAKQHPELNEIVEHLERMPAMDELGPMEAKTTARIRHLLQTAGPAMRMLGLLKVEGLVDWMVEEPPAKRVVFSWHTDVIDLMQAKLYDRGIRSVVLDGRVVGEARQRAVEQFRSDPHCDVLIGQIIAAGEAIDLSVADEVLFLESSWVPGHNEQASRRVVNVGKTRPTNARFVVVPGTVDERIQSTVARRVADIAKLF